MTIPKIALAGAAALALSAAFIFQRTPAPLVLPTEQAIIEKNTRTIAMAQLPFETPSWVPDEATKKKALLRAYELNGNKMCCGSIDVSKEDLTESVTADGPAHAAAEIVDPNERNALDAETDNIERLQQKWLHLRGDRKETDVCKRHGLHKVEYSGKWRCRK